MTTFALKAYRSFQCRFFKPFVLPRLFTEEWNRMRLTPSCGIKNEVTHSGARIWFHAASVGELEALSPLIERCLEGPENLGVIISAFSSSAQNFLNKFNITHPRLCAVGSSPWEGEWLASVASLKPTLFVTARYEAWPDLWASLAEQRVPLAILGARWRPSIQWVLRISRMLGFDVPRLILCADNNADAGLLKKHLGVAAIHVVGDPRWDRAFARAKGHNRRAVELLSACATLRRPWGMLGSAWPEDLDVWERCLTDVPGTLWVIPHDVSARSVAWVKNWLENHTLGPVALSQDVQIADGASKVGPRSIVVDELGILAELYGQADWAYVGGGFGKGIHSTIEPAVFGIPLAAGPGGVQKFSETNGLRRTGQLTVVRSAREISTWLKRWRDGASSDQKSRWKTANSENTGAGQKIFDVFRANVPDLSRC